MSSGLASCLTSLCVPGFASSELAFLPRQSFLTVANECWLIAQAEEERQRPSSRGHEGGSETALVQLRAMQRRSDLHAIELVMSPDDRYHPDPKPRLYNVSKALCVR